MKNFNEFEKLPVTIYKKIFFHYLDPSSLISASRVSKKWRALLKNNFPTFVETFYEKAEDKNICQLPAIYENSLKKMISYQELKIQTNCLANYLLARYPTAKRVGLFMSQSSHYITCMLAIHQIGWAFMPIDPISDCSSERLLNFLENGQIDLIISLTSFQNHPLLNAIKDKKITTCFLDKEQMEIDKYFNKINRLASKFFDLAYIINTSGSTGKPKQVFVLHRGLYYCMLGQIRSLNINEKDRIAAYASIAFDAHIDEIMIGLGSGACLYVVPEECRKDFNKLAKFYETHNITIGVFVPSMLRYCQPNKFPSLKVIICTGEKIDEEIIQKWGKHVLLVDGYGPVENTIATWLKIIRIRSEQNALQYKNTSMVPIPGTEYFILQKEPEEFGQRLKQVDINEEGELYIAGFGLAKGYNDPLLTNERFLIIPHPSDANKSIRVYKTCDIARQNKDGSIDIIGRLDRQVKLYGKLICPEEIEMVIKEFDSNIARCYVDVKNNGGNNFDLIAYIELLDIKKSLDLNSLYENICWRIGQLFAPTEWIVGYKLPSLISQKTTIKGMLPLENLKVERIQNSKYPLPQTDLEKEISQLFIDILHIPENDFTLYRDDDFFKLGGKSIQAAILLQLLKDRYNLSMSFEEFGFSPTVEYLAHKISRVKKESNLPISLYTEKKEINNAPLFLIHSLLGDAERDYQKFIQEWNFPHSVYVIKARGLSDPMDMDNNLYTIALDYYRAIKKAFPHGPKIIAGWSLGGILAVLVKLLFQENGDESIAVAMIDSESPTIFQQMTSMNYAQYLEDLFNKKLAGQLSLGKLPISINELSGKSKKQQIYFLFEKLEKNVSEPGLTYKKGLLATVKGLLLGVLDFRLTKRVTNVHMIAATETQKLHQSENLHWPSIIELHSISSIPSNHDSIMLSSDHVKLVVEFLQKLCSKNQEQFIIKHLSTELRVKELSIFDKEKLKYYVPVRGCHKNNSALDFDLFEYVNTKFLKSSQKILLLRGDSGVGKTTFCQHLAWQLMHDVAYQDHFILYLRFANREELLQDLVKSHLKELGFSNSQIVDFKRFQRFIVILDIEREIFQNIHADKNLDWAEKVIISCTNLQLTTVKNYFQLFYPVSKDSNLELCEVQLMPFNDGQIRSYIEIFSQNESVNTIAWPAPEKPLFYINTLPIVRELIHIPFYLSALMKFLPTIIDKYNSFLVDIGTSKVQLEILEHLIECYWNHQESKIAMQNRLPENGKDVKTFFADFCMQLAETMQNIDTRKFDYKLDEIPWKKFFGNAEESLIGREGCPLKFRYDYESNEIIISFIHPFFLNYFLLFNLITKPNFVIYFNNLRDYCNEIKDTVAKNKVLTCLQYLENELLKIKYSLVSETFSSLSKLLELLSDQIISINAEIQKFDYSHLDKSIAAGILQEPLITLRNLARRSHPKPLFFESPRQKEESLNKEENLMDGCQNLYKLQKTHLFYQTLDEIKGNFSKTNLLPKKIFIIYALPTDKYQEREARVPKFITGLQEHLIAVGIHAIVDIADNCSGNNIYQFMEQIKTCDYILLIGTESLLEKKILGKTVICDELIKINNKRINDTKKGLYFVLPILLTGSYENSFPLYYNEYTTRSDWRDKNYLDNLENIIRLIYNVNRSDKIFEMYWQKVRGIVSPISVTQQALQLFWKNTTKNLSNKIEVDSQFAKKEESVKHSPKQTMTNFKSGGKIVSSQIGSGHQDMSDFDAADDIIAQQKKYESSEKFNRGFLNKNP